MCPEFFVKRFILIAHGVAQAQLQLTNVLPATATTTHVDVGLTWNCTNCQEEFQEEFVLNVGTIRLEDIVIIAKKDTFETQKNRLHTVRHVRPATVIQSGLPAKYVTNQMGNAHVRTGLLDGNATDVLKDISR